MRKYVLVSMLISGVFTSSAFAAAEVDVTWQDPDSYTDVRGSNESNSKFKKRTFKELESYFTEMAEALPDGQKLAITVTNLDLAGQVWPSSFIGFGASAGSEIRLIKRVDIPRISFNYTLTDADGQEVKSAEVKLKDMGFMDGTVRFMQHDNLAYEKQMLKDWFREEMASVVVKNNV
ncbi:DUF3016 domain-containing protein [Alteromonas pelagimontana]|uniref:DUF3016 domain-containing protein n=1 Tax=Alteromonas pelagimontana TaxID=1858656 RepID=A0A6M4MBC0_9ALTE|nr:DUF3016 domain-containing protein [Alteromonas pelagimontana]QJR80327.1 DUF3016 domain-containing protein [Alteromonas pelagimontana]